MKDLEYLLKICILGQPTKMKCDLINTFVSSKLKYYTLWSGFDIVTRKIKVEKYHIKLILVVTNSEGEFTPENRSSWYRGASACIIMFDKSNSESFNVAEERFNEFRKSIPNPKIPIALVGVIGKPQEVVSTEAPFIRLEESEEITTEQGQTLEDKLGIGYVETTIYDVKTIKNVFCNLVQKIVDSKKDE
ncbi:MAG: hypothetical protein ACFE9L_10295 [Candidatus Hodarchaeota archaeon]